MILKATALAVASLSFSAFAFIGLTALSALERGGSFQLLGLRWDATQNCYGLLPLLWNSLFLALCASLAGHVLARGLFFYLRPGAPAWGRKALSALIRAMSGIPTVVYGFTGLFLLCPLIRQFLGGSGLCFLAAAFLLALQGLPAQLLLLDGAAAALEKNCYLSALALGLSDEQITLHITMNALGSATREAWLLGFGRAAGDALIPAMVGGNALQFAFSPLDSMRTLAAHMSLALSSEVTGGEHLSLLLSGGLLLIITSLTVLCAAGLRRKAP